jgi:hypothetical protein
MRWRMRMCALVVLVVFISAAAAGSPKRDARQPRKDQAETCELHGITWQRHLDKALLLARGDRETKERPVLLLRVLGDLDGFM